MLTLKFPRARGPYTSWRVASIVIVGIMTAATGFTAFFIYDTLHSTLSNAIEIEALSSSVSASVIDLPNFSKTQDLLQKKAEVVSLPANLRNVFAFQEVAPPYATSAKKK